MKALRKFILLFVVTLCSNFVFGQLVVSGPSTVTHGYTTYSYTSDPCGQLDLGYDFHDYTYDWFSATGWQYTHWYTYSESCNNYGAEGVFVFPTASSAYWPGYARVCLTFQTSWNIFQGWLDVTVQ
jgi:hypothetical protein